jgi:fucose permease
VGLGLHDAMLGVAWPSMAGELGQAIGALGVVTAAMSAGYVTATVLHGRVVRRVALRTLLPAALAGMALGSLIVGLSPSFALLLAGALVAGLGAGTLDAGMNGFLAVNRGPRLLHLVHAGYGAGTTLGPLLVAAALGIASWRFAYLAAAALDAILLLFVLAVRSSWTGRLPSRAFHGAVRPRATALFIALIVTYVAGEATTGQWSFSVLSVDRGIEPAVASLWVSSFWGAFTIGRVIAGAIALRVSLRGLLLGGPLIAVAGLGWLAVNPFGLGALGLPVAGFGYAPVFSSVVLLTTRVLGYERAPSVIGYQLAGSSVGFAVASLFSGALAETIGLAAVPFFLTAAAALLLVALFATLRRFDE